MSSINTPFTLRTYATSEQFTLNAVEKKKQVEAIVNLMATHEAPGIDKIPVRVIKDCLPYYCLLSRLSFLRHQYIPRSVEAG